MDSEKLNESVQKIFKAVKNSDKSFFVSRKANQRVNFSEMSNIYVLTSGNVSAHAYNSGSLIMNIFAIEIIGLEHIRNVKMIDYIRCVTSAEMYVISTEDARGLFTDLNLWDAAFDILLTYMSVLTRRELKLNQPSAKNTVIEYIKYIWTLREQQRNATSIYVYIMARTNISRSLIHSVISELERKKLIAVSRGVLIECTLE